MSKGRFAAYVDYQKRSREFAVGVVVCLLGPGGEDTTGRVSAVWPGIGMADVEWPHGSQRLPVEELQIIDMDGGHPTGPREENIPGGPGTQPVSRGQLHLAHETSARRVAEKWVEKQAMYWAAPDRKYRASQGEIDSGTFNCPKCKESVLKPASYRREGGQSIRLLGCPSCLFLIKPCDIVGHPEYADPVLAGKKASDRRVRLTAEGC
jgi:hypothetical protein